MDKRNILLIEDEAMHIRNFIAIIHKIHTDYSIAKEEKIINAATYTSSATQAGGKYVFSDTGLEIDVAHTSAESIALLETNNYELILLDGSLANKTSGDDVLRWIHKNQKTELLEKIIVTSNSTFFVSAAKRQGVKRAIDKGDVVTAVYATRIPEHFAKHFKKAAV